ncbi:MFS transporter [Streptomyces sp. NPDC047072]|uniref:MFS transporter n=1 Tax=Streptomyces sp. NPDC047072 TaxID=3154809 RepID=UPI0033EDE014
MTTTQQTRSSASAAGSISRLACWLILGLVLLADALDLIDSTVTNIAAPTIVGDIGGGEGLIKWLGSSYALAMGILLVIGGRLGDRYGQRRMFLTGMAGFTVASAVAGLSPDPAVLIVARVVQGLFGAMLIPQGMAIMTKTFPRDLLKKAFNIFGPLLGVATVGGPLLAGFIIDADIAGLGWRPIFLVNIVLGVVGVAVALKLLPRDGADPSATVDGVGAGLLAVTMFGLMFGLIEGSTYGWEAVPIASLLMGVIFLVLFGRRQATADAPLIKPSLLKNKGFSSGMIVGLLFFAVTAGITYVFSLFIQGALGETPGHTAVGLLPLTFGIIAGSGLCIALGGKLGRKLIAVGMVVTMLGAGLLLALLSAKGIDVTLWQLALPVFVTGVGMGCCYGLIIDIALGDIDPAEAGSASGTLTSVQQLASGIGSAVVTTVYLHAGAPVHAIKVALIVVLAVTAFCLPAVKLLPRNTATESAGEAGGQ